MHVKPTWTFITNLPEEKKLTLKVFLALFKANDSLNHDFILEKLDNYGIREKAKNWISTYLKNRQQTVEINNRNEKNQI